MILKIHHGGQYIYLDAADDLLIFDGQRFLPPAYVKSVVLSDIPVVSMSAPQDVYPIQQRIGEYQLTTKNSWSCTVLERGDIPPDGVTPIVLTDNVITDPPTGNEICLITSMGTWVQHVKVI